MKRFCIKCGNKLEANESFCTKCGFKAEGGEMKVQAKTNKGTLRIVLSAIGLINAVIFFLMPAATVGYDSNTLAGLILSDSGSDSITAAMGMDYTYLLILIGGMLLAQVLVPLTGNRYLMGAGGIFSLIGFFEFGSYWSKLKPIISLASLDAGLASTSPVGDVFRVLCILYLIVAVMYFIKERKLEEERG